MDRVRNEEVHRRAGADERVLRWFGHVAKMDEYRMARRVLTEVSGGRVRLNGWCEGGLGQQRNDSGGCASMSERSERVESRGTYLTERVSRGHFCLALCSFGPPSRALVVINWRGMGCRFMMRLE